MKKIYSLIIALATVFPFVADHSGLWAAVLGTGELSTTVLIIYTAILIAIIVTLLVRTSTLDKREKWIWAGCLVLIFPLASLALLYRLYWRPQAS